MRYITSTPEDSYHVTFQTSESKPSLVFVEPLTDTTKQEGALLDDKGAKGIRTTNEHWDVTVINRLGQERPHCTGDHCFKP